MTADRTTGERPAERRAFLHVGLPKTGTTYLQQALWTNKERLAAAGVLIPGRHRRRHLLASLDVREDPKLARRAGDVRAPWHDLVEECEAWPGHVLVSHEFFGAASTEQVARMVADLAGFEVHVVLTARPMTELGPSRWQEWVKSGGKLDLDRYPPREEYDPTDEWGWGSFDLASILRRWSEVVPPERVHVLPLDPARPPDDLWLRFTELLGVDGRELPAPEAPANTSLGVVEVELLRRTNRLLTDFGSAADRGNWIRGYLAEGHVLPRSGERFRVGEEKHTELAERAQAALDLVTDGGYDVRGDTALLGPTPLQDLRRPSDVSDSELLNAALHAVATLLGDVRSLTRERDAALRERNDLARRCESLGDAVADLRVPPTVRRLRRLRAAVSRQRPASQGEAPS